jgi:(E)-4-hydroxy-3-methylbut-2-enyl-diphosphate synthase
MITYVAGKLSTTLRGDRIVAEFVEILNNYVDRRYAERIAETTTV